MKVFISWSGTRSQAIAKALRDWIPNVMQAAQSWMSDADLDKGRRWSPEIALQLKEAEFGIICLTPENLHEPWILFESGALSHLENTFVCPYLFQVEPADIKWPLAQFQSTKADKDDTRKLMHTINGALRNAALSEGQLDKTFGLWWPELEEKLKMIPEAQKKKEPKSKDIEILYEILEEVQDINRNRYKTRKQIRPSIGKEEGVKPILNVGTL